MFRLSAVGGAVHPFASHVGGMKRSGHDLVGAQSGEGDLAAGVVLNPGELAVRSCPLRGCRLGLRGQATNFVVSHGEVDQA